MKKAMRFFAPFFAALLLLCSLVYACPPPDELPLAKQLEVENIKQNPELPNGCEITSLAVVLAHYGFEVSKTDLADNHLPKTSSRGDPEETYVGSPRNSSGWYCYAGPIVHAANSYLEEQGMQEGYSVIDVTGLTEELLQEYIFCNIPIVAWVTIDWRNPRYASSGWMSPNGWVQPYVNVHCLVVTGYDEEHIYVANPLNDTTAIAKDRFFSVFEAMGSRAVVIEPTAV